jgi:predicted flap endonuclease-1-like 5' DNA nuclease
MRGCRSDLLSSSVSVLILLLVIALALAAVTGFVLGRRRPARDATPALIAAPVHDAPVTTRPPAESTAAAPAMMTGDAAIDPAHAHIDDEKARIIRSLESEAAMLRRRALEPPPATAGLDSGDARRELDDAHAEAARYRQLVIDIENNAPPPILQGSAEPDDLKLIVGVGPVLERMLRNLGIGTFRQIARWSARDVAEFDAKLPEFSGRIERDQWVTQARALHESKYGESPLGRHP